MILFGTVSLILVIALFLYKKETTGTGYLDSYTMRSYDLVLGLKIFLERPIFGFGYMNTDVFHNASIYNGGSSNGPIDRRFSRGLFLTPALLGYDQDEDGNLVVNESEAQTVRVIYYLYLNGFSYTEIAELLTEYGRKTKLGNTEWNPGTIVGVIANERHCGDVLVRKTFTPNFLTHKSKKNNNDRTQYRQRDHHEAIVSREVYNAANHLRASRNYTRKNRPLPVLSVVDDGILRGYVPFDKDWTGFSAEEYREAS